MLFLIFGNSPEQLSRRPPPADYCWINTFSMIYFWNDIRLNLCEKQEILWNKFLFVKGNSLRFSLNIWELPSDRTIEKLIIVFFYLFLSTSPSSFSFSVFCLFVCLFLFYWIFQPPLPHTPSLLLPDTCLTWYRCFYNKYSITISFRSSR